MYVSYMCACLYVRIVHVCLHMCTLCMYVYVCCVCTYVRAVSACLHTCVHVCVVCARACVTENWLNVYFSPGRLLAIQNLHPQEDAGSPGLWGLGLA